MAQCLSKFWGDKKEHYGMLWQFLEWSIRHFRNEAETGSSSRSQGLLGRLLGTVGNWPIADQHVRSNDPRSLCKTRPSFPLVSKVANRLC